MLPIRIFPALLRFAVVRFDRVRLALVLMLGVPLLVLLPRIAEAQWVPWLQQNQWETHDVTGASDDWVAFDQVQLVAGVRYYVRDSGRVYADQSRPTDYSDGRMYKSVLTLPSISTGLEVRTNGVNNRMLSSIDPRGALDPNNQYSTAIASTGLPLSFRFFDKKPFSSDPAYYGDNRGFIRVWIARETPYVVVKDASIDFGVVGFRYPKVVLDSFQSVGTAGLAVTNVYLEAVSGPVGAFSVVSERGTAFTLGDEATNELRIQFLPFQNGVHEAKLHIVSSNALGSDRDRVIVLKGVGQGPALSVLDDQTGTSLMDFGAVDVGGTRSRVLRVTNSGDSAAQLSSILFTPDAGSPLGGFALSGPSVVIGAGSVVSVPIAFSPSVRGAYSADGLVAYTWLDGEAMNALTSGLNTFQVKGNGVAGVVAFAGDTLDFGTLLVGETRTLPATVRNVGDGDLVLTNPVIVLGGVDFRLEATGGVPPKLAPGESTAYAVTFGPAANVPGGLHQGLMTYSYPGEPVKQIVLLGRDHPAISAALKIDTNYYAKAGERVTIVQELLSDVSGALYPLREFREKVNFNPRVLTFVRAERGALLGSGWNLSASETGPGEITIALSSASERLSSAGELLRFKFQVLASAKEGDTSLFPQASLSFGPQAKPLAEPLAAATPGKLTIEGLCAMPRLLAKGDLRQSVILQNSPNPFNPTTTIEYVVGAEEVSEGSQDVSLALYDNSGRLVRVLVQGALKPGHYHHVLDGSELPSGVYRYVYRVGSRQWSRSLVLLR